MIWLPGVDEVPMSASFIYGEKGVTVREVGEATRALSRLRPGELIGVRGPYGKGFEVPPGRIMLVGGGSGMAALLAAAEHVADPSKVDVLIGARTSDELIFIQRARSLSHEVHVSTDDGSAGFHGTVVSMAKEHLVRKRYDSVLGCGPERMLVALLQACEEAKVPCQLSLERFMKCGAGLCGSCVMDGLRVCADGPVFSGEELRELTDFGSSKRDERGLRVRI
jgi:dihydroorotate dehydrogenase electron transfer subunit